MDRDGCCVRTLWQHDMSPAFLLTLTLTLTLTGTLTTSFTQTPLAVLLLTHTTPTAIMVRGGVVVVVVGMMCTGVA